MRYSSHPEEFSRQVVIGGDLDISISHRRSHFTTNSMHTHDFCELVVYKEGRKCVYVNDSIYISDIGCAFTFRPGERHSGVHRKGAMHERYLAQFSRNCFDGIPGGRELLACFFDREAGEHNMIEMPEAETREGFRLLEEMIAFGESDRPAREALVLSGLIRYLDMLCRYYRPDSTVKSDLMPALLREIIAQIDRELSHPIRIHSLCEQFGISQSTLERLFSGTLGETPQRFIFMRRIELAKMLLLGGATVTEACYGAGFGDYSHFIADFRREVGMTPAKFRACGDTVRQQ
jgi:AraC-like DNA-binding protein